MIEVKVDICFTYRRLLYLSYRCSSLVLKYLSFTSTLVQLLSYEWLLNYVNTAPSYMHFLVSLVVFKVYLTFIVISLLTTHKLVLAAEAYTLKLITTKSSWLPGPSINQLFFCSQFKLFLSLHCFCCKNGCFSRLNGCRNRLH